MHIGEILNNVYDDDIGWRPASGAIKPVHVANGLVRAVQQAYFDTRELNQFVVWWSAGKVPDARRAFEALVSGEGAQRLGYLAHSQQDFERTRRYVLGLLGADKALFPSADLSSFSLTSGRMATRDNNDRGLGEFAAFLLSSEGGSDSLADEVLRSVESSRPDDPVTILVWPLLPKEPKVAKHANKLGKASKRKHNREIFKAIREAANCLATHERAQGNRLHTLQRAVHFACVATHAHAQALAADGDLNSRPPALVALAGNRRSDLAITSERSLDSIYSRFERWLGDRLGQRIEEGLPLTGDNEILEVSTVDGRTIRSLLGRIGTAKKTHDLPDKDDLDTRYQSFVTKLKEFGSKRPALVLGHTLVNCYAREYESGGPRSFLQGLGRKVGLLYPHFQGRAKEKRVRPSVPIVDMLVRACVPAGDAIDLDEFLARLWQRFGLIVGGRRSSEWDDAAYLEQAGLPVDIDQLAANTELFINEIVLMGLARRYPDGVTIVGDGYGG
jgi:hypothetical protein